MPHPQLSKVNSQHCIGGGNHNWDEVSAHEDPYTLHTEYLRWCRCCGCMSEWIRRGITTTTPIVLVDDSTSIPSCLLGEGSYNVQEITEDESVKDEEKFKLRDGSEVAFDDITWREN